MKLGKTSRRSRKEFVFHLEKKKSLIINILKTGLIKLDH